MEVYIPGLPHCSCLATIASETLLLLDGLGRRPLQVKHKASLSHWRLREEVECWKERLLLNSVHIRTRMDHLSGLISKRFNCTVPWLLHHLRSSSSYIIGWRCKGKSEKIIEGWVVFALSKKIAGKNDARPLKSKHFTEKLMLIFLDIATSACQCVPPMSALSQTNSTWKIRQIPCSLYLNILKSQSKVSENVQKLLDISVQEILLK